jgi:type VI secretion system lysozyme-related protein
LTTASLTALQQQRSDDRRQLSRQIREAIDAFEPRLQLGEVDVTPVPEHPQQLSIRLQGELRSGRQHWPVAFVIEKAGDGLEVRHERLD